MAGKNSMILWEGPSWIDDAPIVAIATMRSENTKTGDMVQVSILRQDVSPVDAHLSGESASFCGTCPLQGYNGCYVRWEQGPLALWRAYQAGDLPRWDGRLDRFVGRAVRWGAAGDPALIPSRIVRSISTVADGWTGYTHLWRRKRAAWARPYFMASCDTEADLLLAHSPGWRTYRTVRNSERLVAGEAWCPSPRVQCKDCLACDGARKSTVGRRIDPRVSFAIRPHGIHAGKVNRRVSLEVI